MKPLAWIGTSSLAFVAFITTTLALVAVGRGGFVAVWGLRVVPVDKVDEYHLQEAQLGLFIGAFLAAVALITTVAGIVISLIALKKWATLIPILGLVAGFAVGVALIQTKSCTAYFPYEVCL